MLTILMDAVTDSCQLLLLLLGILSVLFAFNWAFKKAKAFRGPPCLRKSPGKNLAAWLTFVEGGKVSKAKRVAEQRSNEDQSLYLTLCTLDRTYMYLARKIKDINGQISRSVSCSSVESVTSLCGSFCQSATSSPSKRPPSSTPAAQGRAAEGGRPRRDTGRPTHVRRRIHFLGYKEQELLEWHVQKKRRERDAPTAHGALRIEAKVQADTITVQQGGVLQRASPQLAPCQGTPPRAILRVCQTPSKPPSVCSCSPEPWPPAPSPMLICPSQSRSSLRSMTGGKRASGTPKEQLTELLCLLKQNKSPTARESRRPGTPEKETTEVLCLLEQNKIPTARESRRPGTPKKETTEVLCLLEQNKIPTARESRRPGTPKKETTEVLCLLEQNKIPTARESRRPGTPKKETTEVLCLLEQNKIPTARESRRPGTPKKETTEVLCLLEQNKIPTARESRRPGTPEKETTEFLCLLEQNKIPLAREARRPGTPEKETTEVLCLLEQNKSPTAREPRRPGTPKKETTEVLCLLEQNKIPLAREARRPGTPEKETTEFLCLLEQNKSPLAREARRPGTPKKETTEVLCLLEQNKSPTAREPRRPGTPKDREKEGRSSSSRRPGTPKEALGKGTSPQDKALDIKISMMLDQKPRRLSWAEAPPDASKASGTWAEPVSARLQLLQPTSTCQNQRETPCVAAAQIQLHQESRNLAPLPAKPQPLARAIVESLDKEQAMRDLRLRLATSVEKGRGWTFTEYPVCLLCGRCTSSCPHPRPRHNPSLLVYPHFSSRDSESHMALSYVLKLKRQEADRFGLAPVVELSKGSRGREPPSKVDGRHSKGREGQAAAAAPQPRAPERSKRGKGRAADAAARPRAAERAPRPLGPSAEAVDLKARGRGAVPLVPKDSFTIAAERSHRHSHKPAGAEAGAGPVPRKPPKSSPNVFKVMCLCLKNTWAKVRGKERAPPSRGSPQKPPPPEEAGDPSADPAASKAQARQGILRKASLPAEEESLTELAAPAKPAAAHRDRRVSLRVPETSRPPKKGGRRQPKSAASKKLRRRS